MNMRKETKINLAELILIAGTRALLGCGVGLLASGLLSQDRRKILGWAFVGIGALTTIPLALDVFQEEKDADGRPLAA